MEAGDTLYLENLEEFVNDEDKIVTYKWLSRTLSVSANKAKQMLYAFVKAQQEESPDISHSITYVVGGKLEIEGNLAHKYVIVTDQDLEDTKKQFSPVTCVHIYSVQKCKLKDSNCLYTVDYDIVQEHKKDKTRSERLLWSHIHCKEAQCAADRGSNRGSNGSSSSTTNASSVSKMFNGTTERPFSSKGESNNAVNKKQKTSNVKTRKGQMSTLEMFAKKPSTSSEKKEKDENTVKTEGSSVAAKKSKPGSMKSFFGKSVAGSATKNSEEKKEKKKITPTKVENKDEKRADKPRKSSKLLKQEEKREPEEEEEDEEEPVPKKISKRMNRGCDTEEEPVKIKKSQKKQKDESHNEVNKRKTKKKKAFIHESDGEPEEETPAEKEQPKEKKSRKKRKRTKDLSEDDGPEAEASSVSNSSVHSNESKTNESESALANQQPRRSNEGTRRRKRRKFLKSKTSMNEDGYMVTEKVWESESTDASDEEKTKEAIPSKIQAPVYQKSTRSTAAKHLSDAKPNKPGKQASLMTFFQKS